MAAKITKEDVITFISNMTVLELSELIEEIENKFNVSAAAPVAVAAPAAGEQPQQAEEAEKTEFDVMLTAVGDKKIQVIKVVRAVTNLGLKEAKEVVDNVPGKVREGVSREDAENIKKQLEEVGAVVDIT
ncbi:MAG TPA: 50S ribosomal protein L7/L12 [Desulfatiglandales bacterium]|nr:50S ribosomal protein L7/L12 [Desulfatiglandales bacterium]